MKKSLLKTLAISIAIAASIILPSCDATPDEPVDFKVISSDPAFTGYYIVDGEEIKGFDTPQSTGSIYYIDKTVNNIKSLEISASRADNTYSLEIRVYRDDKKVKSASLTTGSSTNTLELYYEFGEEESSSTSG
jgi:hypothetical protein